jgi:hypothetical protein
VRALATSLALAGAVSGWFWFDKPWISVKQNGDKVIQVGTHRWLEECRKDVAKMGGNWCGKGCKNYGQGSIADCKPLLPVR